MKLNYDNVHSLMFFVEEKQENSVRSQKELTTFADNNGISRQELAYILRRLKEADLIKAKISIANEDEDPYDFRVNAITWSGHEYLESIR